MTFVSTTDTPSRTSRSNAPRKIPPRSKQSRSLIVSASIVFGCQPGISKNAGTRVSRPSRTWKMWWWTSLRSIVQIRSISSRARSRVSKAGVIPRVLRIACQPEQFVDHLAQRLRRVHIDRSGRFLVAPIQREHELDSLVAERPVVIGARFETAAHGVLVD